MDQISLLSFVVLEVERPRSAVIDSGDG
jgi:hypothetical protein